MARSTLPSDGVFDSLLTIEAVVGSGIEIR